MPQLFKRTLLLFTCSLGLCFSHSQRLNAAEIDVAGIVGITFDDAIASVSITSDFNVHGLDISPQAMTLAYSANTFKLFGSAIVKLGDDQITVSFGDEANPGLVVNNGSFDQVSMGLTADFNLKSMGFSPDGLSFEWNNANSTFDIYGAADVSFDSEMMSVGLGNQDSPGIVIFDGSLSGINLSVTADFTLKNLSFSPNDLTFQWDSTNDLFEMFGGADVSFDSETMTIGLGDEDAPGIEINTGVISKVNLSVSADFTLKNLSFSPSDLTFQWDNSTDFFEIFGEASLTFDGTTMTISLGDGDDPGIELVAGVIDHVNIGITAGFDMKGISFSADGLTFEWDKATDFFEIYGTASTSFDNESIDVSLGDADDPGIEIDNGVLDHINLGITADFNLKTMEFEADGLTYEWDKANDQFEIYGSTTVKFDGEEIDIGLGDADDPGVAVKSDVIQHINMDVNANFTMKAFTFKPTDLTFQYDRDQSHFEMFGSAKFTIENHDAVISMGDDSDPGLVFKNSRLQHINLSITEDFELKGLTVKTSDVGVEWDSSNDYFNFHGDIDLELGGEEIDADMGTSNDPGMQFRNGRLHSFDVTVNSDFKLGNLEVTTKDVNVKYSSNKFEVNGTIEVDEVWSVEVELGNNGSGGLEILTSGQDKIKVDDFTIDIKHVDLGAIDFKEVEISFRNDAIHEAKLDVSIPPGYEVSADMTFAGNPAKLNSIDISFDATNFDTAIPIGDTGIELVHIEGGMFNLADPSTSVQLFETVKLFGQTFEIPTERVTGVYFQGSVGFVFGGPVSLDGKEVALIYQEDDATISGTGVNLSASLLIGAYRHSSNSWRSLLGEGSIDLDLEWGRSYSISAFMKIPSDPLVEFNAKAKLAASGNLDALLTVKLKVPKSVPFVGGKTLGSVSGGLRYNRHDLHGSYGAGWASYHFFGTHHFGARYRFSDRKVSVIGSGTVSDIERQIKRELGSQVNGEAGGAAGTQDTEWTTDIRSFTIPPNNSSMIVELDMRQPVDEVYLSMIGPEGFYDLHEIIKTVVNDTVPPLAELGDPITKFEADSAATLLVVNHEPENDALESEFSTLAPGQYDLMIAYRSSNIIDSVGVQANYFRPTSTAEIEATQQTNGQIMVDMEYWAHLPDSTELSVFWNDTASYSGTHIATLNYGDADENGFGTTELLFEPQDVIHGDTIYFYYILQDSTNVPVYSSLTDGIEHQSPVNGKVVVTNPDDDTVLSGIMVFIDENGDGFFDTEDSGGSLEPSVITDDQGNFHFNDLTVGESYTIDLVIPFGFTMTDGASDSFTFVYTGQAQQFNFNITRD